MTRTRRHSWGAQLGSSVVLSAMLLLIPALPTEGADLSRIQPPVKKPIPVAFSKFSGPVYKVYQRSQAGLKGATLTASVMSPEDLSADSIRVVFELSHRATSSDSADVVSRGGRVEAMAENLIQAWLPLALLKDFNGIGGVDYIRFPFHAESQEIISEGVAVIRADLCGYLGVTGQGVTVAILDLGFVGYTSLLGTELPTSVTTRSFRADGNIFAGTEHGTACAEIVHDIAPDAELVLANFSTDVEFLLAVDALIAAGVSVITNSTSFFSGPTDGTGLLASKVDAAAAAGIVWCNSTGNGAQKHWTGFHSDPDADGWLNFLGEYETNDVEATAGVPFSVYLDWYDWPVSDQNFDLYIYDTSFAVAASSVTLQNGSSPPEESIIGFTPTYTGTYHIAIRLESTTGSARLHLRLPNSAPELWYAVPSRSLRVPSDANGSLSVGAVDWFSPFLIEAYSNQGPTEDGRTKPDVVGPDGVSTASYGLRGFFGTSASTPHAAGVAALTRSQHPSWSSDRVKDSLRSWALDRGATGPDNVFGWGLLQAECGPPECTISEVSWTNEVDNDGDGFVQAARLIWNPNVLGCSGTLSVFEKIYWKRADSSTWNLFATTPPHTIYDCNAADTWYVDVVNGSHSLYDWKIEGYRVGQSIPDIVLDPATDVDLNDVKMETAEEDVPSYLIAGYVLDAAGGGIADALMSGLPGNPQTNASGYYGVSVEHGWSGTVTPTHQCYTLSPPSRTYAGVIDSYSSENFTGTLSTFTISGFVKDGSGPGIGGVTLIGLPGDPVTDAAGYFTVDVDCGWSGSTTPTLSCYVFDPPSRVFTDIQSSQSDQDFVGASETYQISGFIRTAGGVGMAGVSVSGLPGSPVTNSSGFYSAVVDCGWTGTASPALVGYDFSPASRFYSDVQTDRTNQNYTVAQETFVVSGHVTDGSGAGIPGVALEGLPGNPQTDAEGYYSTSVVYGWSGPTTPSHNCYSIFPQSRFYLNVTASRTNQDYTGTLITYEISGYLVAGGGEPLAGVVMNGLPGNPTTDGTGFFRASVACGWAGTVTPAHACYTFNPLSRSYSSVLGPQVDQNFAGLIKALQVSGYVRTDRGVGIAGVTVSGLTGVTATSSRGFYSGTVSCGWSGSVSMSHPCYSISPASRAFSNLNTSMPNQDFTGSLDTYEISGYIRATSGAAVAGVSIIGLPGNPITNLSGFYSTTVDCGWSGAANPTIAGYEFIPASRTYNIIKSDQTNQDYAADLEKYDISGHVRTGSGFGIEGVIMNGLPGNPQTDPEGSYSSAVEYGWSGTVTPSNDCYTIDPPSRSYMNITGPQSDQNFTGSQKTLIISGYVSLSDGGNPSGIVISGLPGSPITDAAGFYSASVPCGWSGYTAPSLSCYAFDPIAKSYVEVKTSKTGEDFVGTHATYQVSGYVRSSSGSGVSGVIVSGLPGTPVTNASGYFTITVDCGWSGTVTPSLACYTFFPVSQSLSDITSTQSGTDFAALLETFAISGRIVNRLGGSVDDVQMTGMPGNVRTNTNGSYQGMVNCGWSGTIVPSLPNAVFDPPQQSYSDVGSNLGGQDFTVNQTPRVPTYADATVAEGLSYSLLVEALDPDGETPVLTVSNLPQNSSFVDNGDGTGLFEFAPGFDQAGTYSITFEAGDGALLSQSTLTLVVTNTNRPPSGFSLISPSASQLLRETTIDVTWHSSTDPDPNEAVSYWVFVEEGLTSEIMDSLSAGNDTTATLSDLAEEATYSWRVVARDTTGGETINTGGWRPFSVDDLTPPELFFGMILSSVLPFSVDLVVKPSEELEAPVTAGVTIGATHDTVKLDHRIESSDGDLFSARYGFTSDGSGIIVLRGSDLSSNEAVDTIPFSGYRVATGASLAGISYDQSLSVRRARGLNASPTLVISYPAVDALPFERVGWRPLGAPCLFASADRSDGSPLELRFSPRREIGSGDLSNIVLFQLRDGQWEPLQTWRSDRNGDFVAYPDDLGVFLAAAGPIGSDLQAEPLPRTHILHQNVPNPFNPGTTIAFEIGEGRDGIAHRVSLDLFNMLGQRVRRLLDETLTPGHHSVAWNGADDAGSRLPSGVYFARLTVENEISTIKMVLMK